MVSPEGISTAACVGKARCDAGPEALSSHKKGTAKGELQVSFFLLNYPLEGLASLWVSGEPVEAGDCIDA